MVTSQDYLDIVLEHLSNLEEITYRPMMGEYVLYYKGKVFGGIYDDRFLVKATKTALKMMPNAKMELPYQGAKEMILIDDEEKKDFLQKLLDAMYEELPAPKNRKTQSKTKNEKLTASKRKTQSKTKNKKLTTSKKKTQSKAQDEEDSVPKKKKTQSKVKDEEHSAPNKRKKRLETNNEDIQISKKKKK